MTRQHVLSRQPHLQVTVGVADGQEVVRLSGELDMSNVAMLHTAATELDLDETRPVTVNLADLDFCDAVGARELVALNHRLQRTHPRVLFAHIPRQVRRGLIATCTSGSWPPLLDDHRFPPRSGLRHSPIVNKDSYGDAHRGDLDAEGLALICTLPCPIDGRSAVNRSCASMPLTLMTNFLPHPPTCVTRSWIGSSTRRLR